MSDKAFIDGFLAESYMCRLGVTRDGAAPLMRPLWYLWEDGRFHISTRASTSQTRAVKRNPLVTICVDRPTPPYAAVIAEGLVELTEGCGKDHELLSRLAQRYLPPERVAWFLEQPMSQFEDRVRFLVQPQRITIWNNSPDAPIGARPANYS